MQCYEPKNYFSHPYRRATAISTFTDLLSVSVLDYRKAFMMFETLAKTLCKN